MHALVNSITHGSLQCRPRIYIGGISKIQVLQCQSPVSTPALDDIQQHVDIFLGFAASVGERLPLDEFLLPLSSPTLLRIVEDMPVKFADDVAADVLWPSDHDKMFKAAKLFNARPDDMSCTRSRAGFRSQCPR